MTRAARKKTRLFRPWFTALLFFLILAVPLSLFRPDIPRDRIRAKYAQPPSRFITIKGMDIHYRDEGQGFPLLLIHGTAASLHTWDGWTERLKPHFRIIRLDLPGYGVTGPSPDRQVTIPFYLEVVDAFVQNLGISKMHLAGNSLGGLIAWQYAASRPQKTEKLILVAAAGYPPDKPILMLKLAGMPGLKIVGRWFTPRFLYAHSLQQVYGDPSKITPKTIDRYYELALGLGNRRTLGDRAASARNYPEYVRAIPSVSAPVLIMWGEQDRWIPVSHARLFHRDLHGSQLIVYDGAGHIPMEEIPDQTARDALEFLRSATAPALPGS